MKIAVDVMGGDHAPAAIVAGAVEAARREAVTILLVGPPALIQQELAKHKTNGLSLPIIPATQVIGMDDKPATVVRTKRDSSMSTFLIASKLIARPRGRDGG